MIRVAFVCLGNICRSPMAEAVFKHLLDERGIADGFEVDSFGTSDEEEGNGIYPPALRTLAAHGIEARHTAKRMTAADVEKFDYVLAMETRNIQNLMLITNGRYYDKVKRLCDYTAKPRNVIDPWYSRNFDTAYADIYDGCKSFLDYLTDKHEIA